MQFTRSSGKRFYKRLFLVGVEGTRTECDYFSMFDSAYVHVIPVASREGNSPKRVLTALKAAVPRFQLRDGDYLWIVVDRDEWPEEELELCRMWALDLKESPGQHRGFSLSNPKFEFWLLLHFEDGTQHTTAKACLEALCAHLPEYKKSLVRADFGVESVSAAIQRAKTLLGAGDPAGWPREADKTTVFTLCEAIRQVDAEELAKIMADLSGDVTDE